MGAILMNLVSENKSTNYRLYDKINYWQVGKTKG